MPTYNLLWSRPNAPINGVKQDPTTYSSQATASTPEKAAAKIYGPQGGFDASEVQGFTFTWQELNEDGEVVRTSESPKKVK